MTKLERKELDELKAEVAALKAVVQSLANRPMIVPVYGPPPTVAPSAPWRENNLPWIVIS